MDPTPNHGVSNANTNAPAGLSRSASTQATANPLHQFIPPVSPAQPVSTPVASSPHNRQSQPPFRYVRSSSSSPVESMSEKVQGGIASYYDQAPRAPTTSTPRVPPHRPTRPASSTSRAHHLHPARQPSPVLRSPSPLLIPASTPAPSSFSRSMRSAPSTPPMPLTSSRTSTYTRPRGLRIINLIKSWLPLILYVATSLAFVLAISFWKAEVFEGLDELSHWLQADEYYGYAVLFALIFITTFPPVPLYSTLIILSGYTFGAWTGAVISYFSALLGAITVFTLCRTFLRTSITQWLNKAATIKRVVRAIEKRPKLLFLIRLAPYPYNVMNCLLAASPTLTFKTYTICTALSLFKVIIHTAIGSSIHSFADYHLHGDDKASFGDDQQQDDQGSTLSRVSTFAGIGLCIAILVYLSYVARKAIDDELGEDGMPPADSEETIAFLSPAAGDDDDDEDLEDLEANVGGGRSMAESPFTPRVSFDGRSSLARGGPVAMVASR